MTGVRRDGAEPRCRRPRQAAEGPTAWIETEERRAEAMVRRLRRANARYVPGFGFVPAVRLTVPARALQGRLRSKT